MTTPTTDGIRGAVVLGFQTYATIVFGVSKTDMPSESEILSDFEAWLRIQRASVYQEALEDVQNAINASGPVDELTVLTITNPYVSEA